MPTYLYRREDDTTFEVVQRMTDDPLTRCPTTDQEVYRIPYKSQGSVVIKKGGGWTMPSKGVSALPVE
jgi:predicted nucleic acid-binding Zn ribbon protein